MLYFVSHPPHRIAAEANLRTGHHAKLVDSITHNAITHNGTRWVSAARNEEAENKDPRIAAAHRSPLSRVSGSRSRRAFCSTSKSSSPTSRYMHETAYLTTSPYLRTIFGTGSRVLMLDTHLTLINITSASAKPPYSFWKQSAIHCGTPKTLTKISCCK